MEIENMDGICWGLSHCRQKLCSRTACGKIKGNCLPNFETTYTKNSKSRIWMLWVESLYKSMNAMIHVESWRGISYLDQDQVREFLYKQLAHSAHVVDWVTANKNFNPRTECRLVRGNVFLSLRPPVRKFTNCQSRCCGSSHCHWTDTMNDTCGGL
jgi:hypothetical protein